MTARSLKLLAMLSVALFLSACGDGWEMIRTDTMFPYGNQRTAGSSVAYVRAKMLPERDLKLEPAAPAQNAVQVPVAPPPAPVIPDNKMDEIFTKQQSK